MSAEAIAAALKDLVAFTTSTEWDELPEAVQRRAALVLSDDLAAMVAARDEPELEAFSAPFLSRPSVAELRRNVTMAPYEPVPDWPNDRPTRVTWTLKDGQVLSEEIMSTRGGPDLPFGPDEIRRKICEIIDLDPHLLGEGWGDVFAGMTVR